MTTKRNFFSLKLFLGVSLTTEQMEMLDKINPILRDCFVKNGEDAAYLTHVEFEDKNYLGKFISSPFPVKELDNLEKNIISLTTKVLHESSLPPSLQLIPLPSDE